MKKKKRERSLRKYIKKEENKFHKFLQNQRNINNIDKLMKNSYYWFDSNNSFKIKFYLWDLIDSFTKILMFFCLYLY